MICQLSSYVLLKVNVVTAPFYWCTYLLLSVKFLHANTIRTGASAWCCAMLPHRRTQSVLTQQTFQQSIDAEFDAHERNGDVVACRVLIHDA